MSLSITRGEGVTVLTINTDSSSAWPPLCQILKGLCYNPTCCSVSQRLRTLHKGSQSLLGALHIMTGLISIGLALILALNGSMFWWYMDYTAYPFWLGGVFVSLGVVCVLSERFPSPCLLVLNAILQLAGVCFSIAAIVLYSIDLATIDMWEFCENYEGGDYFNYQSVTTAAPSAQLKALEEKCLEAKDIILMLLISINVVLVVLAVLELCLTISSSVLGIQSLRSVGKNREQDSQDPDACKPLVA